MLSAELFLVKDLLLSSIRIQCAILMWPSGIISLYCNHARMSGIAIACGLPGGSAISQILHMAVQLQLAAIWGDF
jgi:hypothetical protein